MDLEKNKKYVLAFNFNGKILTYEGVVVDDDGSFVTFYDRYNNKKTFNKSILISVQEVDENA